MQPTTLLLLLSLSIVSFATPLHMVAIGDTGKDNAAQVQVAEALARHCSQVVCHNGLLLGDNLYQEGMLHAQDPRMDAVFKKHYDRLKFPFYVTLGNHDYGKLANNWTRGRFQLEYSRRNPQYVIPHFWYLKEWDQAVLVVLDTARMMWSKDLEPQKKLLREARQKAAGKFLIVMGHHPYLSNGKHGNAGNYERISAPSFVSGSEVKKFLDQNVCGKADLYLSGHDHNLQILNGEQAGCSTTLLVSGAGASTTELFRRNLALFEARSLGFASLDIEGDWMKISFYNEANQNLYQTEIRKKAQH